MKRSEKVLFYKLKNKEKEQPLSNVRKALGSVGFAKGNPFTKTEISIQITMAYDDGLGNVIAPAALPPALQTFIPFYLFGLTDFYGAYLRGTQIVPAGFGWGWSGALNSFGIFGLDVFGVFPGLNPVFGDLIISFIPNPPVLGVNGATVCIHCNNVAYGTFLNSFVSDLITISVLRYIVPIANVNQFVNPLVIGTQSIFGKVDYDSIDPRIYITPKDFQQQISDIPINLPIDKSVLVCSRLNFDCQFISFVLFVQKVEALTNRPKL